VLLLQALYANLSIAAEHLMSLVVTQPYL